MPLPLLPNFDNKLSANAIEGKKNAREARPETSIPNLKFGRRSTGDGPMACLSRDCLSRFYATLPSCDQSIFLQLLVQFDQLDIKPTVTGPGWVILIVELAKVMAPCHRTGLDARRWPHSSAVLIGN